MECPRCKRELIHETADGRLKARTRMAVLHKGGDDDYLMVIVCPSCKADICVGQLHMAKSLQVHRQTRYVIKT